MKIPKIRLFLEAKFEKNSSIELSKNHTHFLLNVLRLSPGVAISLFNGQEGEWIAKIKKLNKKQGVVKIEQRFRPAKSETGPWLIFSPVKKNRTDFIIEKATELGVERLIPILTEFTGPKKINTLRLSVVAQKAAEQCGRLSVPVISQAITLEELIQIWPANRCLLFGDETGKGDAIKKIIGTNRIDKKNNCGFLIGPEGGFSSTELSRLRRLNFGYAIDLGPRILRSETATIAAISAWQALTI